MRRVLGLPTWTLLGGLVAASALVRAWAGLQVPTPWIAPDELIYAELGRRLWQTGHLTLLGHPTSFFSLVYPALAGLPLSLGSREFGYDLLKVVQAVVMSLTAVPVYLWGRELASRGWALVAAALTIAPAGLAYSGLIMTEVAFYPAFVVAAWAIARAVAVPTTRRQTLVLAAIAVVCAIRLQAIVLVPAYVTAALLDAGLTRSRARLRQYLPFLVGLVALLALWSGWQLRHGGPIGKVLGGYQAAGETSYDVAAAGRFVLYHLGDLVLISGVVPFCALALLAATVARGEVDAGLRAFIVTTVALAAWVVLEVGIFASRHVGHLAERNLFPLVPLLVLALVVWLDRGAARPVVAGAASAAAAVLLLVAVPFKTFTTLAATPSSFTQIPLLDVASHVNLDLVVPILAAALLAACAFVRLRALVVGLPILLLVLGAAASVSASRFVATQARDVQSLTLAGRNEWVRALTHEPVAFLYSGYVNWETAWQIEFWNPNLNRILDLGNVQLIGGIPQENANPFEDGRVVDVKGAEVQAGYVLAAAPVSLVGQQLGSNGNTVLWKVEPPLRIHHWMQGVEPDGSVPAGNAGLRVYACAGGRLAGAVVTTQEQVVTIARNGTPYTTLVVKPGTAQAFDVPVAVPAPAGQRLCTITIQSELPFALTTLTFS